LAAADDRTAIILALSGGNEHDAPEGRKLLERLGKQDKNIPLGMDKAYEGDETRDAAIRLNLTPVVPPKTNRKEPWDYDKEIYKRRNIVERLFRRMKEYRKIFTRYDKLDVMFLAYIYWGLTFILLCSVNTP
jgi:transposase